MKSCIIGDDLEGSDSSLRDFLQLLFEYETFFEIDSCSDFDLLGPVDAAASLDRLVNLFGGQADGSTDAVDGRPVVIDFHKVWKGEDDGIGGLMRFV